jgi:hypothetical protein
VNATRLLLTKHERWGSIPLVWSNLWKKVEEKSGVRGLMVQLWTAQTISPGMTEQHLQPNYNQL